MVLKYKALSNSTAERDPPGCPLPPSAIIFSISIRMSMALLVISDTEIDTFGNY